MKMKNKFFVYYTNNNSTKQHIKGFETKGQAIAFGKAQGDNLVFITNENGKNIKVR
jgi:hypothetical protein